MTPDIPYTLVAGDPLLAAELNENFEALAEAIGQIDVPAIPIGVVSLTVPMEAATSEATKTFRAWPRVPVGFRAALAAVDVVGVTKAGNPTIQVELDGVAISTATALPAAGARISVATPTPFSAVQRAIEDEVPVDLEYVQAAGTDAFSGYAVLWIRLEAPR